MPNVLFLFLWHAFYCQVTSVKKEMDRLIQNNPAWIRLWTLPPRRNTDVAVEGEDGAAPSLVDEEDANTPSYLSLAVRRRDVLMWHPNPDLVPIGSRLAKKGIGGKKAMGVVKGQKTALGWQCLLLVGFFGMPSRVWGAAGEQRFIPT